jgi:predicted naringenin-chalcone synthase
MRRYLAEGLPLGKEAVGAALVDAGLRADEVGLLAVISCTGYATPGLDIHVAADLGMAADVQRLIVGHMGCYAAIPGLGAVADYVVARGRPAVALCLELTSLHLQPPTRTGGSTAGRSSRMPCSGTRPPRSWSLRTFFGPVRWRSWMWRRSPIPPPPTT